jgi:hypothetical protein
LKVVVPRFHRILFIQFLSFPMYMFRPH